MNEETYTQVMLVVAQAFEVTAAVILMVGLIAAGILSLRLWVRTKSGEAAYKLMRQGFGGVVLLSLEVLVAGDLIRTVAVAPTLDNVIVLGLIVLIRTFLSFSLEIEIDGVLPWRKALVSGATVISQAQRNAKAVPDAAQRATDSL
ncbi:MAG: DUF1622 domain-containing protein [Candidatus Nanopelagicales bacterium]|jgi:uncharacterized membrane protein